MEAEKEKIFRDSIHGYISIPEDYCRHLIDTPHFQRLRNIEQTSMRVLYPSAHHDRFVHSLGVYYLGSIAFDHLCKNAISCRGLKKIKRDQWQAWRHSFLIACLMHDCAHSPFSHTFEKYYDRDLSRPLRDDLARLSHLKKEVDELPPSAEHEKVSAILVLKVYKNAIHKIMEARGLGDYTDVNLIIRMITGWDFSMRNTVNQEIESCLIRLLNGTTIDVDKLDYIIRDTWASGFNNTTIDVNRLLSALTISTFNGRRVLAFNKSALSVIQNVILARNYLYRWIYPHHKVVYDKYILDRAVQSIPESIGITKKADREDFINRLFSVDALLKPVVASKKGHRFYLPNDGDLIYFIKNMAGKDEDSFAYEWVTRRHKRRALWKTHAEFCIHLPDRTNVTNIVARINRVLDEYQRVNSIDLDYVSQLADARLIKLNPDDIYVNINNATVQYKTILAHTSVSIEPPLVMPYVYINKTRADKSHDIIAFIKKSL